MLSALAQKRRPERAQIVSTCFSKRNGNTQLLAQRFEHLFEKPTGPRGDIGGHGFDSFRRFKKLSIGLIIPPDRAGFERPRSDAFKDDGVGHVRGRYGRFEQDKPERIMGREDELVILKFVDNQPGRALPVIGVNGMENVVKHEQFHMRM